MDSSLFPEQQREPAQEINPEIQPTSRLSPEQNEKPQESTSYHRLISENQIGQINFNPNSSDQNMNNNQILNEQLKQQQEQEQQTKLEDINIDNSKQIGFLPTQINQPSNLNVLPEMSEIPLPARNNFEMEIEENNQGRGLEIEHQVLPSNNIAVPNGQLNDNQNQQQMSTGQLAEHHDIIPESKPQSLPNAQFNTYSTMFTPMGVPFMWGYPQFYTQPYFIRTFIPFNQTQVNNEQIIPNQPLNQNQNSNSYQVNPSHPMEIWQQSEAQLRELKQLEGKKEQSQQNQQTQQPQQQQSDSQNDFENPRNQNNLLIIPESSNHHNPRSEIQPSNISQEYQQLNILAQTERNNTISISSDQNNQQQPTQQQQVHNQNNNHASVMQQEHESEIPITRVALAAPSINFESLAAASLNAVYPLENESPQIRPVPIAAARRLALRQTHSQTDNQLGSIANSRAQSNGTVSNTNQSSNLTNHDMIENSNREEEINDSNRNSNSAASSESQQSSNGSSVEQEGEGSSEEEQSESELSEEEDEDEGEDEGEEIEGEVPRQILIGPAHSFRFHRIQLPERIVRQEYGVRAQRSHHYNRSPTHLNSLPPQLKHMYYVYQENAYLQKYDSSEPYMRVTVMRTNADPQVPSHHHIITPQGMVRSRKNTTTEDIIIGRQESTRNHMNQRVRNQPRNLPARESAQSEVGEADAEVEVESESESESEELEEEQLELRPNDIVLPNTDRAISRIHCRLVYKDGFRINKKPKINFILFLFWATRMFPRYQRRLAILNEEIRNQNQSGQQQQQQQNTESTSSNRLHRSSIGVYIPEVVLRLIWSFARPKLAFYLVDIGSGSGTFLKIQYDKSRMIQKGQVYLIGADTQFSILDVSHDYQRFSSEGYRVVPGDPTKINTAIPENPIDFPVQLYKDVQEEKLPQRMQDEKEFIDYLLRERLENTVIHGLTQNESEKLEVIASMLEEGDFTQVSQLKKRERRARNVSEPYWLFESEGSLRPIVKIRVKAQQSTNHLFLLNQDALTQGYKIGRSQECTVQVNINTISRKQTRIVYQDGKWQIKDGDVTRESANGTWISLNECHDKEERPYESKHHEVEDGTEIKISDQILKLQIFNNESRNVPPKFSFHLNHINLEEEFDQSSIENQFEADGNNLIDDDDINVQLKSNQLRQNQYQMDEEEEEQEEEEEYNYDPEQCLTDSESRSGCKLEQEEEVKNADESEAEINLVDFNDNVIEQEVDSSENSRIKENKEEYLKLKDDILRPTIDTKEELNDDSDGDYQEEDGSEIFEEDEYSQVEAEEQEEEYEEIHQAVEEQQQQEEEAQVEYDDEDNDESILGSLSSCEESEDDVTINENQSSSSPSDSL